MVRREGRSLGDALGAVTAAEAPFVQVPNHINVRDGQITLVNNDHTILGLRTAASLAPFLPEPYRLLPLLQAVWYVPAGLDIWNQLLGKYPGRYATMKGMNVPPPSYGPVVWNRDEPPITQEGPIEEQLHAHMIATMSGDVRRSYGLFLGLAGDARVRPLLRDHLLFLGLIDLQDTIIGRKARNTGHKALRARAVVDLADVIGWDQAHGVYYIGVPDMAVGPLYYSLYDAACVTIAAEFPDAGKSLKAANTLPLTPTEVEEMVQQLTDADPPTVWNLITAHLRNGKSLRSLGDTIQIGAAELILRTTVPRQFTDAQHAFDYCNVANYWMRGERQPVPAARALPDGQLRQRRRPLQQAPHLRARARVRRRRRERALARDAGCASWTRPSWRTTSRAPRPWPPRISTPARIAPPTRQTIALAACKFQDDPHNQKITHSTFEEYGQNTTHLRDRLLLATARLLAGWPKMPGERDCYARFTKEWINN